MSDSDVPGLTALAGASLADTDLVHVVDVSATPPANGTDKKQTIAELVIGLSARGLATDAEVTSAVAALSTVYQPLDSDLTSIAALTTTSFGRAFLALADASAARTAIGTVIGTDVQAYDSDLQAIGALAPSNDDVIQRKAGAWTNRTIAQLLSDLGLGALYQPLDSDLTSIAALTTTSFGRAFLALADASAARTAIGVVIGTDVQAYDADLAAIAALTSAANKVPYATGTAAWALADYTAVARTFTACTTLLAEQQLLATQTINAQTGTTYTLVAGDVSKLVTCSNGSAITLTVPQDSDVTWAVGDWCEVYQLGAGQVTVAAGSGATLRSTPGAKARAQYSRIFLQKISANTWALSGDCSA